ncbi:MAG: hypothetical protein RIR26_2235 [Pseudomonadota bacterium]|jgi:hypothetical protein
MKASGFNLKASATLGSLALATAVFTAACGTATQFNTVELTKKSVLPGAVDPAFPSAAEAEASSALGLNVTGAYCAIDLAKGCRNGKVSVKSVIETPATVYGSYVPLLQFGATYTGEACRLRALQYAQYCQNDLGQTVESRYVDQSGKVLLRKIGDAGKVARVAIKGLCAPIGPAVNIEGEDTWGEGFGDPEHDLAQANQRFLDHVSWCKATPSSTHIVYTVIQGGRVVFQKSNR